MSRQDTEDDESDDTYEAEMVGANFVLCFTIHIRIIKFLSFFQQKDVIAESKVRLVKETYMVQWCNRQQLMDERGMALFIGLM